MESKGWVLKKKEKKKALREGEEGERQSQEVQISILGK